MVCSRHQQRQRIRLEAAVVKSMHHATDDVQFFQQHRQRLMGIHRGLTTTLCIGVGLQRRLQLVGNADVVHHQTAFLVAEHTVDTGNGLHQVVALHGLVHVHRVAAGRIEAGQPHVPHDHQLQRIGRILEAFFQTLLCVVVVQMALQPFRVGGRAGHDDSDGAPVRVGGLIQRILRVLIVFGVMPFRTQCHDGIVQLHADVAAHAHDHPLALGRFCTLLEVIHQIGRNLFQAGFCAHQPGQRRPLALGLLTDARVFLVFDDLIYLRIERVDFGLVHVQSGQPAFVVDLDGGTILHRILNVVDAHIVAKHRAGVLVLQRNGRTGKADERGVG